MIVLQKTDKGFVRIAGNPTLDSLDGETRAPLETITHHSWSDEERARFGVYVAEPFAIPDGMQASGDEHFELKDGKAVQVIPVAKIEHVEELPSKYDLLRQDFEALAKRVKALESSTGNQKGKA